MPSSSLSHRRGNARRPPVCKPPPPTRRQTSCGIRLAYDPILHRLYINMQACGGWVPPGLHVPRLITTSPSRTVVELYDTLDCGTDGTALIEGYMPGDSVSITVVHTWPDGASCTSIANHAA